MFIYAPLNTREVDLPPSHEFGINIRCVESAQGRLAAEILDDSTAAASEVENIGIRLEIAACSLAEIPNTLRNFLTGFEVYSSIQVRTDAPPKSRRRYGLVRRRIVTTSTVAKCGY